jgi:hypothetical protein
MFHVRKLTRAATRIPTAPAPRSYRLKASVSRNETPVPHSVQRSLIESRRAAAEFDSTLSGCLPLRDKDAHQDGALLPHASGGGGVWR